MVGVNGASVDDSIVGTRDSAADTRVRRYAVDPVDSRCQKSTDPNQSPEPVEIIYPTGVSLSLL